MSKNKWTAKKKEQFLAELRKTANISHAARACNVSRPQAYWRREVDEEFAQAWDDAIEEAVDRLEAEAWRRAHDGVPKPVFYKGRAVGEVYEFSDRLLERLLEAHRPEKYKQRQSREVTGKDGGPIQQEHKHGLTPEAKEILVELTGNDE